jgi:hypothetical protein
MVKTEDGYRPMMSLIKLLYHIGIIEMYTCFYAAENKHQMINVYIRDTIGS